MIGVFDSGVGGLTVLRAIKDAFPSIDVVYFGDTKNAPYGPRSREDLSRLTAEGITFLLNRNATTIVSACNSVSASLAISLYDALSLSSSQIIEMVGPTVAAFRGFEGRVAIAATEATIQSGIYQNAFRMIGIDMQSFEIPELAGLIEAGASEEAITAEITRAFHPREERSFDVLILGCTHYPLVIETFRKVLGETVALFDPADAVANRVERELWPREAGSGAMQFYISRDSEVFRSLAERIFPGAEYSIEVVE